MSDVKTGLFRIFESSMLTHLKFLVNSAEILYITPINLFNYFVNDATERLLT